MRKSRKRKRAEAVGWWQWTANDEKRRSGECQSAQSGPEEPKLSFINLTLNILSSKHSDSATSPPALFAQLIS